LARAIVASFSMAIWIACGGATGADAILGADLLSACRLPSP
jgi:hypothetical protein